MTPEGFWTSTLTEIRQVLESRERRLRLEMQRQAAMDYRHAFLVGAVFAGKAPPIHEAYPGLFEEKRQDWRVAKERLMKYAEAHNRKMRKKGGEQE